MWNVTEKKANDLREKKVKQLANDNSYVKTCR